MLLSQGKWGRRRRELQFNWNNIYKKKRREMTASQNTPPADCPVTKVENLLGLLRIKVKRGINLAVRDVRSSDPYVVVRMGNQRLKTRVMKKNVNPVWNDDLTLPVLSPNVPIQLAVYDHDIFTKDDKMGDAEFDIKLFLEAVRMQLEGLPSGTVITRTQPCRTNCLAEESCIFWNEGQVVQDMCLRLRNVECGELELQLHWIDLPDPKGL